MTSRQLALFATLSLASLSYFCTFASARDCRLEKKAEIPLSYSNGLATIQARINDTPVVLGIDTGAQTVVTPETSEILKLDLDGQRTRVIGTTAEFTVKRVLVNDLDIGGLHFTARSVQKIAMPQVKGPGDIKLPRPLDGLIGMDILADYDIDFDFPHRKLTLYKAYGCLKLSPPDFIEPAVIPFKFNSGRNVLMPLELNGTKLTGILDTGATLHGITRASITGKIGVTEAMLKTDFATDIIGIGNVTIHQPFHTFKTLNIGDAAFNNILIGVVGTSLNQADMLVGQTYLFAQRFWISSATQTLFVERTAKPGLKPTLNLALQSSQLPSSQCNGLQNSWVCQQQTQTQTQVERSFDHSSSPEEGGAVKAPVASTSASVASVPVMDYGALGITQRLVSRQCLKALKAPIENAVIVARFAPISAGQKAGLRVGDLITVLNDKPVYTSKADTAAVGVTPKATFKIWRETREISIDVAFGSQERAQDMRHPAAQALHEIEAERLILAMLPAGSACSIERAIAQTHLGAAYMRAQPQPGLPDERFEIAIKYLEQGLSGFDRSKDAILWTVGQIDLGDAYRLRSVGEHSQNIEKAIQAYHAVLTQNLAILPNLQKWRVFTGLGQATLERSENSRSENIERAIELFRRAIEIPDIKVSDKDKADLLHALANAYYTRLEGQRDENVSEALSFLNMASVYYQLGRWTEENDAVMTKMAYLKNELRNSQSR